MSITELQRQMRRKYLGSSDSPTIMNLSPYKKTAKDIYWSKVSEVQDETKDYMDVGTWLEGPILEWAANELGVKITRDPGDLFEVAHAGDGKEIFAANHDSLILTNPGSPRMSIEAKYANSEMAQAYGEPFTDQVPYHVIVQVQHAMYVSQLAKVYVALAVPSYYGIERRLYIVPRDEDLIAGIVEFGCQWWSDHVQANVPPNGDGTPPLYVLKALERREGAKIQLSEAEAALATQRTELKAQIKALTTEVEISDSKLIHALGDAEIGLLPDGRKLTYHQYSSNRFDTKRFKMEHPELAPDYTNKSSCRTLYVKKGR